MKKRNLILALSMVLTLALTGCGKTTAASGNESKKNTADLKGKTLHIYCGAGMANPFKEIADTFKAKTGCEMNVTYGNAGQIQSQINTAKEGDIFIAGSADEIQPVSAYVSKSKKLVKHIPVLAVASGNPKSIKGLSDLTKDGVSLIIGDTEATPIGKIAKKALSDLKIFNKVKIAATTTTAPQMTTAIAAGQADASIVWKENCNAKGVEVVNTTDLDKYVKTVPAAALKCTSDQAVVDAFMSYLDTDAAKQIWTKYGYVNVN
ncbi:MAG: molybdate ABC transporter substrate-binding protein [Bacillota bacterium]|nr:molybdate ABC transporter substrate-binding protein [Bacillota bacterium]